MGNERLAKIKEFGETELTSSELAEMSDLDFSNAQVELAKKMLESSTKLNSANFETKLNRKSASDVLKNALFG
jgi:secreted Zn-dependent insulinase-like peptidase